MSRLSLESGPTQSTAASAQHTPSTSPHHALPTSASFTAQIEELNFYNFFGDLLVPEENERQAGLERISERLIEATRECLDEQSANPTAAQNQPPSPSAQLLTTHLPSVLRLALACPLHDITSHMKQLLQQIAAIDPKYQKYVTALDFAFQPSLFVPLSSCVDPTGRTKDAPVPAVASNQSACGETTNLLEDIFLSTGRVSHMDLLMAWHPTFLTQYTSCLHYIMEDVGPLPQTWRRYLAIMAAARHHCEYLVSLQETEYLLAGGDPIWLKGIAFAPKKLQSLCDLNALLAHQPWLITKSHIATLVDNAGTDFFSVTELVQALVILTTFHALSGFVFGMGLTKEIDSMDWASWEPSKNPTPAPLQRRTTASAQDMAQIASLLKGSATPQQQPTVVTSMTVGASPALTPKPTISDGEQLLRLLSSNDGNEADTRNSSGNGFNSAVEELSTSPATPHDINTSGPSRIAGRSISTQLNELSLGEGLGGFGHTPTSSTSGHIANLNTMRSSHIDFTHPGYKYLAVPSPSDAPNSPANQVAARIAGLKYVNFDVNSKAYSIFFLHDYSWKEHGYALINRFYQDPNAQGVAQMLDLEWDGIFQLTYNTVSDQKNVDTTPFRRAIWYYTHRLFGLQHDDFNYNKIPIFLTSSLKTYVKKIACAPETVTQQDYELKGYNFKPDEKAHIVLLTIEARRQASLLYALHSVMQYMVQQH